MPNTIFAVSTLHFNDEKYGASPRTPGWFFDLNTAVECVTNNWGDIFETVYEYALIEQLPEGLYPQGRKGYAEHWFRWTEGGYKPCDRPKELEGTIGGGCIG